MKNIYALIAIFILSTFMSQCYKNETKSRKESSFENISQLPNALFVTTGINFEKQDPALSEAVVIAIQSLNKRGIKVRLEPRDVLYEKEKLSNFSIIILSSSLGIHDADRKYSLTYMTDHELNNLKDFVNAGGVLIAGDNIGRNYFDGSDRIKKFKQLTPSNYPLSEVFGAILEEKNMKGYRIIGKKDAFKDESLNTFEYNIWTLVPDKVISRDLKVLASWENGNKSYPAITKNKYGNGTGYLLASSEFLQPANNGGYSGIKQIQKFYNYVVDDYLHKNKINLELNPWPNGYDQAFAISFNSGGTLKNYKFVTNKMKKNKIKPIFFVNGKTASDIKKYLVENNISIASSGYRFRNYKNINYSLAVNDILRNENEWERHFSGFRFPYTTPNYFGLLAADLHNYKYESSISVNNIDFIHGSNFPHNLVISHHKFYKSSNMLEIAPTYHDDFFFLGSLDGAEYRSEEQMKKDIMLYNQYLQNFWEIATLPNSGLMLILAHPNLIGKNNNSFKPIKNIINTAKKSNTWITDIETVANYTNDIQNLRFFIDNSGERTKVLIKSKNDKVIKGVTLISKLKPVSASCLKGNISIKKNKSTYLIIFDAFNNQELEITSH